MHISNYTDVDLIKLSIIQCIVNFLPGYRFTSENSSMSLGWSCWWNEPDSSVQRSIWNTVHLHDWKEQKERPLLCQVHWILSNAVHSKGAVLRSHLLQSNIAKEKKHICMTMINDGHYVKYRVESDWTWLRWLWSWSETRGKLWTE